jgi:hypothetical protein
LTLGALAIEPIQNRFNAVLQREEGPKASAESRVPHTYSGAASVRIPGNS